MDFHRAAFVARKLYFFADAEMESFDIVYAAAKRRHTDAGYPRLLLQEFLLAIDVTSSGTPEEKLKWAFRMYDVDGNGVIDMQEMTKIVQVL